MRDASEEECEDCTNVCDDFESALDHVLGYHLDVSLCWETKYSHAEEEEFKGDTVKVFFYHESLLLGGFVCGGGHVQLLPVGL